MPGPSPSTWLQSPRSQAPRIERTRATVPSAIPPEMLARAVTRVLSPYRSQITSERTPMPDTTCHMSISLDGFVAGPDQSRDAPLGKRGRELHAWHLGDERANDADATAAGWLMRPRGAYVMGRNMFGPLRREWGEDWRGWGGGGPGGGGGAPAPLPTRRVSSPPIPRGSRSRWKAGPPSTSSPTA